MIMEVKIDASGRPMVEATEIPGLPLACCYWSSSGPIRGIGLVVQVEVVLVGNYADGDREGAADQLELGRDLGIGQVGVVAALPTDDLERVGLGAFSLAVYYPGWLAAENHRPAVPGPITGSHTRLLRVAMQLRGGGSQRETVHRFDFLQSGWMS